ncbi:hypothetical protein SARC_12916 [Sphaeroforma arctica JP610]|uniref:Uncharacterized protein n=1 Tax=Sphaeroforma arctica JP610 TaxID=667725 RepID=A0A0L0FCP0_9EUKA|nr:hypothetical protein SARC_12916 [Sphaeroforma arctica JP610]KNC74542.1 hypothetical protein SARC_12916 [Sphaeroforma arctica JP610]|eukprot:XP_014148444.1 hypothetical protein SARC_12916 [Sphaeroforma arctica JP610]
MMPHIALVAMAVRDEQLFDDAVDCLVGVFNRSDINKYPKCLNDMVATVLSLSDSIFRTIEEEDEDAANGMVFLLVTVVDCLRPMIVNPESSEQIQCCAQLLTLLLACAEFPDTCMNESVSQSTLSAFGLVSEWIREEFVAGHGFSEGVCVAFATSPVFSLRS